MTSRTFILRELKNLQYVVTELMALTLDPEKPLEVVVREHKSKRSLDQNALYWARVKVLGDHFGYHKDEMHEVLAHMFLAEKSVTWDAVEIPYRPSTTKLNTKEMAEYMHRIEHFANEHGVAIPYPEDREREAA